MPRKLLFAILSVASLTFVLGIGTIYFFFIRQPVAQNSLEIQSPFVGTNIPIATPVPTPRLIAATPTPTATPKSAAKQTSPTDDSAAKISALEAKIADLENRLKELENNKSTPNASSPVTQSPSPQAKEFYIYLGSGASTDRNWTDIGAASGFVDTSNYGQIKAASFEAAMSIIGGETHARLKNKTTGEIYYFTEISHNTGTSTWIQSGSFSLTPGSNEYVVQVRSTSGEQARLDGSRIKILVQ